MPDLQTASKKTPLVVPDHFQPAADAPEEADPPKRFPPIQIGASPASKTSRIPLQSALPSSSQRTTTIRVSPESRRTQKTEVLKTDAARSSSSSATPETERVAPQKQNATVSPVASIADDLTVESVCSVLFAKSFPGAEERAAFEAMKGRRVRWSGELQTSMPFSMDFVFGSQKGVKSTVLVCKLAQGSVPVQIKAVAAFPPTLRETLESLKGKTIVFEGELLKFEPFAREIYLQDATLES